jgi:hypothetical protein
MGILGYNTIGTLGTQQVVTGGLLGSKFTATENGGITSITAYISSTGTESFKYGIYSDNAGIIGNLIATSRQIGTMTTTPTWITLTIYANIVSGSTYWLTAQGNDNVRLPYDLGTTNQSAEINVLVGNAVVLYPTFPFISTSNIYQNRVCSIYATYGPSYQGPSQLKGVQSIKGLQSIKF